MNLAATNHWSEEAPFNGDAKACGALKLGECWVEAVDGWEQRGDGLLETRCLSLGARNKLLE